MLVCFLVQSVQYRLYCLTPPSALGPRRPALIRQIPSSPLTASIRVEIWDVEPATVGRLLEMVSAPLAFGSVVLESGEEIKGFVCEGWGGNAEDMATLGWKCVEITEYGGWEAYAKKSVNK